MNTSGVVEPNGRVVYLIGNADNRLVKIGMTTKGHLERLNGIQTMSPSILTVLWTTPGGRELEHKLHYRFRRERLHGEWFDFGERDPIAEVSAAAAELTPDVPEQPRASGSEGEPLRSAQELIEDLRDVTNELGNVLIEDPVRTAAELADHLGNLRWAMSSLKIAIGMLKGSFDESSVAGQVDLGVAQQVNARLDSVRAGLEAAGSELGAAFGHLTPGKPPNGLPPWCGQCGDGGTAARFNVKLRTLDGLGGSAICPRCHPLAVGEPPQPAPRGHVPYQNPTDQSVYFGAIG